MTERKCACNKLFSILANLAGGPQHREIGFPISTDNASWGGAPTQRISRRNSTGSASWGGPNTEADGKSAYNNVRDGNT
ncbi:nitrogen fixation protein NifR [Staphylococcus argenteus]|nr:nitrogen fixation protein NifR [Staphylococcus argenteus]